MAAIHLRQLAQTGCRELGVDIETARGHRRYGAVGSEDDDGYDPYSDRRPVSEPLFERDPWS